MNVWKFFLLMAGIGYAGGAMVGWGLSEKEIKVAMCSYYSEWKFCREVKNKEKEEKFKDLAIEGLSKKLYELERKLVKKKEYLCVKAHRLNIRLYPLDGKVIGIYRKGARVSVIDRIGGWVRTKEGWVSEKWLERCGENGSNGGNSSGSAVSSLGLRLPEPSSSGDPQPGSVHKVSVLESSEVLR